jgi:alpha-1,4-digalacturonate transport system permease protein
MRYVYNSAFVAVVATAICVAVSSAAGYGLAVYRRDVKSANVFFAIFLMGTLVPGDAQIVAKFDVIMHVGLFNNIWGVILPTVASTTGIFLYRQFFTTVPMSLVEAARIDGASEAKIFFTIMFPLAKATTVTLIIFSFVWRWNDYLLPLVVLSDQDSFTIQIAVRNYIGNMNTDWNSILAATVLSIIPLIIVFAFLQKHIMGGIATSGMKN